MACWLQRHGLKTFTVTIHYENRVAGMSGALNVFASSDVSTSGDVSNGHCYTGRFSYSSFSHIPLFILPYVR